MIEIIGTKNSDEKELEWRSLPKNVRQIGEGRERRKIYMEDYVVTYLGKLAKPDQVYARGAILFGETFQTEEGPAIFISGAVEARNLELDMDETIFDEFIWEELLKKGKQYFPGKDVVGWFLSRIGFSVEMNQKIINTHLKNFPGEHKVLYMIDSLEKEDAMYLYENGQMRRQRGYFIYYEKNSAMQDYMLENDGEKRTASEETVQKSEVRRDRKIVNSYRKMSQYSRNNKKQSRKIQLIRAACVVLIFIMGAYIMGRLGSRFQTDGFQEYAVAAFQTVKNTFSGEKPSEVEEETHVGDSLTTEEKETETDMEATETTIKQPQPLYYTVQKGDTLAAISRKMYSTDQYASQIAEVNDISNVNEIYEGQKILIPSVKQEER